MVGKKKRKHQLVVLKTYIQVMLYECNRLDLGI